MSTTVIRAGSLLRLACLAAVGAGIAAADEPSAERGDNRPPLRVEQLEKSVFQRVPGKAGQGSVLGKGPAGSWYADTVGLPTVHFDGELYRMWFSGDEPATTRGFPYGIIQRIGLATSTDGVHFEVANNGRPVLEPGPEGSADDRGLAHPFVLRFDDRFWMWYGAIDGTTAGDLKLTPASVRVERICLATSGDGIHWQRENGGRPVLDIGPAGTIDCIQATGMHVLRIADRFVMWYGAYGSQRHVLAVATSPDGIHWERSHGGTPVTGLLEGGQGPCGVSVYFDGQKYFMLYGSSATRQWNTYAAVSSDGFNFTRLHGDQPILGPAPEGNFDTAGIGRNRCVHPTQFIILGNKVWLWYVGEDGAPPHGQRIGLMEAVIP